MASLIGDSVDNSMRELQVNKMKYCMHKDDIAIGLGRPMYGSSISSSRKKAYPSVIVTLASMEDEARYWIAIHNFLVSDYTHSSMLKEQFLQVILNGGTAVALGNDDMTKAAKKFGSDECKKRRIKFHVGCTLLLAFLDFAL